MVVDWKHEVVEQLDWHWRAQLRRRLGGLTDDEYLWEPVEGCWSLRPRQEATTRMAAGAAELVIEFEYPDPTPPPVTTIAWRIGHIAIGCLAARASNHFGDGSVSYQSTDWSLTAEDGLALLDDGYDQWMGAIRQLDAEELAKPCGPSEGPWADKSMAALVLHINREVIHHGAEIALLRDLYRRQGR